MCGICGKLVFDHQATVSYSLVKAMTDTIRHRGPDDEGHYVSGPVALGFRRLSIIDLESGHQPLSNEDGSIWIVFNGEIYNYLDLRFFLLSKGHVFKTKTDTEVIVHLYEEYGQACFEKMRGMFSLAIWNKNDRTLLLARDRVGIKPLYYRLTDKSIVFASEIKAILGDPSVNKQMTPELIDRFLTLSYMPGEETLLKGIKKLLPGHYMLVNDRVSVTRQFWDLEFNENYEYHNVRQVEDDLQKQFAESVGMHMMADVPVGVLLSGGVDSTGVLSFASQETNKQISTFTVGFGGDKFADERPYAKIASDKFSTRHYEMTITASDFAQFIPKYVWHMEEPVCEPPAIALYYVSKMAREHVTVLLSGEGGDEAFAGYSDYRNFVWLERIKRGGALLNSTISRGISFISLLFDIPRLVKYVPLMLDSFPDYYCSRTLSINRKNDTELENIYTAEYLRSVNRKNSLAPIRAYQLRMCGQDKLNSMLYIDTKTWLLDDLLIKADKMTMANSVELRVPLLDHKILEFAASLSPSLKLNGITTKYIMKKALSQRIPKKIRNRKKIGFPVPYERWLQADLKDLIWDVLLDSRTIKRGYFSRVAVERLLRSNAEGNAYAKKIFSLLILELWQRTFLENEQVVL
jgi:asparagine synthase (glutamine-hydrolysing)